MQSHEQLARHILQLRGQRVILDLHLAQLYGVPTRRLNEQVRRNARRFPREFSFTLTNQEAAILKSHFATSSWGGKRKPPRVFTEHGAIMAATILNSSRAIEMSVYVVRAFVQLRDTLSANAEIARRLDQLERKFGAHDRAILEILQALRQLTQPAEAPKRRRIGFVQD
jgi:ORF6N domain